VSVIKVEAAKLNVVFRADALPKINPENPEFLLNLSGVVIKGKINPKAARKLAAHTGGAVLGGKLVVEQGQLVLTEAGFQFLDPKPAAEPDAGGSP
jgi:hypothetical protein